jgi:hypothetical protein
MQYIMGFNPQDKLHGMRWCFVLVDQHTELDILCRHFAPLIHIIPIPSQPAFALTPYCVLSEEAAYTNFIVFGLTWLGSEPMTYNTRAKLICVNM